MKKLLLFAFIISMIELHGQNNTEDLIMAEKSFAAYSVEHGTKAAFLKFLDSNGVVFEQGKPVNGLQSWNKRQDRPGILNWYPVVAEIAGSGDFGYTSGPWTFQPGLQDSVVARGQFNTVWHRTKNGEWKFLVDLGVSNASVEVDTNITIKKSKDILKKGTLKSMLQAEDQFIQLMKISEQKAYDNYVSTDARLVRNGIAAQEGNLKEGLIVVNQIQAHLVPGSRLLLILVMYMGIQLSIKKQTTTSVSGGMKRRVGKSFWKC